MDKRLPIVDISAIITKNPESLEFAESSKSLYQALSEVGFAIVTGHHVASTTTAAMRKAVATVFETPREVLLQDMVVKGNYRGFVPLGFLRPIRAKETLTSTKHGNCTTKLIQTIRFAKTAIFTGQTNGQISPKTSRPRLWTTGEN